MNQAGDHQETPCPIHFAASPRNGWETTNLDKRGPKGAAKSIGARLRRLQKNSAEEIRSVRARLQSCHKLLKINAGL